jgi:hypothetical protein
MLKIRGLRDALVARRSESSFPMKSAIGATPCNRTRQAASPARSQENSVLNFCRRMTSGAW